MVLGLLVLYFAVMTLEGALLATSGRSDDLETLLLSQSLEWGYEFEESAGVLLACLECDDAFLERRFR